MGGPRYNYRYHSRPGRSYAADRHGSCSRQSTAFDAGMHKYRSHQLQGLRLKPLTILCVRCTELRRYTHVLFCFSTVHTCPTICTHATHGVFLSDSSALDFHKTARRSTARNAHTCRTSVALLHNDGKRSGSPRAVLPESSFAAFPFAPSSYVHTLRLRLHLPPLIATTSPSNGLGVRARPFNPFATYVFDHHP